MAIKKDTLDHLLDGRDPKEVFSKDGLFDDGRRSLVMPSQAGTNSSNHRSVARSRGACHPNRG